MSSQSSRENAERIERPTLAGTVVTSSSRRTFLRGTTAAALIGGAGALLGTPRTAMADHGPRRFYEEFRSIRRHENNHVEFLLGALGSDARPKPTFQNLEQATYADFVAVTQALEQTGVGAYLGAVPFINNADILSAAASVALIEANHAGFANALLSFPITGPATESTNPDVMALGRSFALGLTPEDVGELAGPFIAGLNNGPPIDYSETPSSGNDVDILNFALALEFLEADFYNINVPKFFEHG